MAVGALPADWVVRSFLASYTENVRFDLGLTGRRFSECFAFMSLFGNRSSRDVQFH